MLKNYDVLLKNNERISVTVAAIDIKVIILGISVLVDLATHLVNGGKSQGIVIDRAPL